MRRNAGEMPAKCSTSSAENKSNSSQQKVEKVAQVGESSFIAGKTMYKAAKASSTPAKISTIEESS
jgi:hypothetical protein